MNIKEGKRGNDWPISLTVLVNGVVPTGIENYHARYSLALRQTGLLADCIVKPTDVTLTVSALGIVSGSVLPEVTKLIPPGKYFESVDVYDTNETKVKSYVRIRQVVSVNYFTPVVVPET